MRAPRFRCSETADDLGESLLATASTIPRWLLLEHPGPWGVDALRDARLPGDLGVSLARDARRSGVRVVLIRRPSRARTDGWSAFACSTGPADPWIERRTLDRLEDAAQIDLAALGRGQRPGWRDVRDPVMLVCTHGRRDPCCAERGRPLAAALASSHPDETWESSHIGGDRFAANLLTFPHGCYFGRVSPEAGPRVADAYASGRLNLDHFRGRSCRSFDAQAVEGFARSELALDRLDDILHVDTDRRDDFIVGTAETSVGRYLVRIGVERSAPRHLTCHSRREETPSSYRLVSLEHDARRHINSNDER